MTDTDPIVIPAAPKATVLRRNITPDDGWRFVRRADGFYDYSHPRRDMGAVLSWSEVLGRCGTDGVIPAVPLAVELEDLTPELKQAFLRIQELEEGRSQALRHREAAEQFLHDIEQARRRYYEAVERTSVDSDA